jgi:hypothetical protein
MILARILLTVDLYVFTHDICLCLQGESLGSELQKFNALRRMRFLFLCCTDATPRPQRSVFC